MYDDLRSWLEEIQKIGQLQEVRKAHWNLEVGAVIEQNQKNKGPTLIFDEITDYPKGYRIVNPNICNAEKLSITLGLEKSAGNLELTSRLRGLVQSAISRANQYEPKIVSDGPVLENYFAGENVDLTKFPTPFWHELDGGRYIGTGCVVLMKDPKSGCVNGGCYRVMLVDKKTITIQIGSNHHGAIIREAYFKQGKPCPVAIVIGPDPLLWLMSGVEIPEFVSELNVAGAIRGTPCKVTTGKITGLPIPASSDLVLEGYSYPNEEVSEGPFGEFTGYYVSGSEPCSTMRVEAVYHRDNPIILGARVGRPPHDHSYWRNALVSALVWSGLERHGVPEVKGVWCHDSGVRFWMAVSIKQRYPGHSTNAGLVASQLPQEGNSGRYVIVVDDDIDPSNMDDVIWAIGTRSDPKEDIQTLSNLSVTFLDPLTYISKEEHSITSRAIIDACIPFSSMKTFPKVAESSGELRSAVIKKYEWLRD